MTFLAAGMAFAAAAGLAGQVAFAGVATAFIGLGIAFIARSRKDAAK